MWCGGRWLGRLVVSGKVKKRGEVEVPMEMILQSSACVGKMSVTFPLATRRQ